jgi:hypothetical protein
MSDSSSASPGRDVWYYVKGDEQIGPLSSPELSLLAKSGALKPDTLVWKEGMAQWQPVRNVTSVLSSLSAKLRTPVPPPLPQLSPAIEPAGPTVEIDPQEEQHLEFARKSREPLPIKAGHQNEGWRKTKAESNSIPEYPWLRRTEAMRALGPAGIHIQRISLAITAIVGMLGTFVPWITVPILGSVNGTQVRFPFNSAAGPTGGFGLGWLTLFLFIPALFLAFSGDARAPLVAGAKLIAAIPAGLAALLVFIESAQILDDIDRQDIRGISFGVGLFFIVLAGIGVAIVSFVMGHEAQESPQEHHVQLSLRAKSLNDFPDEVEKLLPTATTEEGMLKVLARIADQFQSIGAAEWIVLTEVSPFQAEITYNRLRTLLVPRIKEWWEKRKSFSRSPEPMLREIAKGIIYTDISGFKTDAETLPATTSRNEAHLAFLLAEKKRCQEDINRKATAVAKAAADLDKKLQAAGANHEFPIHLSQTAYLRDCILGCAFAVIEAICPLLGFNARVQKNLEKLICNDPALAAARRTKGRLEHAQLQHRLAEELISELDSRIAKETNPIKTVFDETLRGRVDPVLKSIIDV